MQSYRFRPKNPLNKFDPCLNSPEWDGTIRSLSILSKEHWKVDPILQGYFPPGLNALYTSQPQVLNVKAHILVHVTFACVVTLYSKD